MKDLDELIEAETKNLQTFHPVHQRGKGAWFPGNEAAALCVQVNHIWEDIHALHSLHMSCAHTYKKKLLLKYLLIELRSLVEVFERLYSIAIKTPIFDPNERHGWREITQQEHDELKSLLKIYSKAKKSTISKIIAIRHNVGAHRGNINFQEVMTFWDNLTLELMIPLLDSFPAAFNHIRHLDLYEWNCTREDGVMSTIGLQLRPEYFKQFGGA